ncbi:MAG: GNAT family N-acetyltransferase [Nocardioides sp.]
MIDRDAAPTTSADASDSQNRAAANVELTAVGPSNWRQVAELRVSPDQQTFVTEPCRYLALCAYDNGPWYPLAITSNGTVVGFVMSAVDPDDGSAWIGGLLVDRDHQGRGYGRAAVIALVERARAAGHMSVALSYQATNVAAANLYASLGFVETGETEDDEPIARLRLG